MSISRPPHDADDYAGLPAAAGAAPARHRFRADPEQLPACRFYGCSHVFLRTLNVLQPQYGNECALIMDAYAPCKMEVLGQEPDEKRCPIARRGLRQHPEVK